MQIQHSVNKEIAAIKNNMASATDYLEDRTVNKAASDQQFSMTATNNLALILSEMLNQMQKDLQNQQREISLVINNAISLKRKTISFQTQKMQKKIK